MRNPIDFKPEQIVMSVYSNKVYMIMEHKKGMSKLLNVETGRIENWNSCNNPHFTEANAQLKLF